MRLQSGLMVVDTHGMDSSTAAGRSTWRSLLSALQAQRCGVAPVQTHADAVAPADIMQGTVVHIANQRTSVFVRPWCWVRFADLWGWLCQACSRGPQLQVVAMTQTPAMPLCS